MAVTVAHVFPGFLTPVPRNTTFSFQSHQLRFSHASAEVRGKNMPRNFASTRDQTHNHQVMSLTRSPLSSHPGKAAIYGCYCKDDNLVVFSLLKCQLLELLVQTEMGLTHYQTTNFRLPD